MSSLAIDWEMFMMAFAPDADYQQPYEVHNFLDIETGDMVFTYTKDEEAEWEMGMGKENARPG